MLFVNLPRETSGPYTRRQTSDDTQKSVRVGQDFTSGKWWWQPWLLQGLFTS